MSVIYVRGAQISTTQSALQSQDLLIADGVIVECGSITPPRDAELIDAAGLVALPGLVDLHTHLREPGNEDAETVESGSRAAARGGYTAVFAMPNTHPATDSQERVEATWLAGRTAGYVDVHPIGAVTAGLAGHRLADIAGMAHSQAGTRVFSDDGQCVSDAALMLNALRLVAEFDGVIAQHAQEPRLTEGAQANDGPAARGLGVLGWPGIAEEAIIARDVELARDANARLHICHVSTAAAVEVIRWAKKRGIRVSAEVTPHHLLLSDEVVQTKDPRYKVNPPLRGREDTLALRDAVVDGSIDIVATDHAPHSAVTKSGDWVQAANGMVGLESALSVVHEALVHPGMLGWRDVARIMSRSPAKIGRIETLRDFVPGEKANFLLYDPSYRENFGRNRLSGRSANSPFFGMSLPGQVVHTVYRGRLTVRNGAVVGGGE